MKLRKIKFPPLHKGQLLAARSERRFRLLACGRRWGKTRLCAHEAVKAMLSQERVWHVAPTYSIGLIGFRDMITLARKLPRVKIEMGAKKLSYKRGSVEIKSADYPNNLRGEGLDFLIMDEAAYTPEDTWLTILRPALMDRRGRALLASSPNGKNWFYNAHKSEEWASWRFPTWDSPYVEREEIEVMRSTLPKSRFAQEVAAEFVDFVGRVFPPLHVLPSVTTPNGEGCVFGIDVARSPDATAVAIAPSDGARVWCVEQTHRDYAQQMGWFEGLIKKWKPQCIVVEENGVGAPIVDMLQRISERVVPFTTTNKSKTELIDQLIVRIEQDKYAIPDSEEVVSQFETYTCSRNALGTYTFSAPKGLHDDAVLAVMLVQWAQQLAHVPVRAFRL